MSHGMHRDDEKFYASLTTTSLPIYWVASPMGRLNYSGVYMVNLQLFLVAICTGGQDNPVTAILISLDFLLYLIADYLMCWLLFI